MRKLVIDLPPRDLAHSLSLSTHSHNQGPPRTTFALPFTPSWPLMRLNSVVNEQQPFPFIPHSPLSRSLRRPLLTNSNTSNLSLCWLHTHDAADLDSFTLNSSSLTVSGSCGLCHHISAEPSFSHPYHTLLSLFKCPTPAILSSLSSCLPCFWLHRENTSDHKRTSTSSHHHSHKLLGNWRISPAFVLGQRTNFVYQSALTTTLTCSGKSQLQHLHPFLPCGCFPLYWIFTTYASFPILKKLPLLTPLFPLVIGPFLSPHLQAP